MTRPGRFGGGIQSSEQASWDGDSGKPGLYPKTGEGWVARFADNSEVVIARAGGGLYLPVTTPPDDDYTVQDGDVVLDLAAWTNGHSVFLPPSASSQGRVLILINAVYDGWLDPGIAAADGTDSIDDGGALDSIASSFYRVRLMCVGTHWQHSPGGL